MMFLDRHCLRGAALLCASVSLEGCWPARHAPASLPAPAPAAPAPVAASRAETRPFVSHCSDRWTIAGVPGGLAAAPHRALRRLGLPVRALRSADSTGIQLLTDPSPFPRRFDDGGAGQFLLVVEMLPAHPGKADSTAMHLEVRVGPIGSRWLAEDDSIAAHHAAESLCAAALRATKSPRSSAKGRAA